MLAAGCQEIKTKMKPILFQLLSHNNMENAPAAGAADNQNPIGHAPAASSSQSDPVILDGDATPPRKIKDPRRRLHVYKGTKVYSLAQQHEIVHEVVWSEVEFENKKLGKRVVLDPADLVPGSVSFFWAEVTKNCNDSPAFKSKSQTVISTTLRAFFESAAESKKSRMEAGESHEDAYMETGTGDDDDLLTEAEKRERETVQQLSYQIEEALFTHIMKMNDRKTQKNDEQSALASKVNSGVSGGSGCRPQHKRRDYDPPANTNDLTEASLHGPEKKSKKDSSDSELNPKAIRQKQVEKHLSNQSDLNSLGQSMMSMCKPPTLEENKLLAAAQAEAYCGAFGFAVKEGIEAWRKAPEKPKHAFQQLTCGELYAKIAEIPMFKDNVHLQAQLLSNGVDGPMLAFLPDTCIEEFFVTQCAFTKLQAGMMLAKIKSWT